MDLEILNTLQTIRGYLFVTMIAIVAWVSIKGLEILVNIFERRIKVLDTHFSDSAHRMLDEGNFQEAEEYCKNKLARQPNNATANWLIAKAYYFLHEYDLAVVHFEKATYLMPSWEEDAQVFIDKIRNPDNQNDSATP